MNDTAEVYLWGTRIVSNSIAEWCAHLMHFV